MTENLKQLFNEILKDKNGNYSLREAVSLVFVLIIIISWVARQFFHLELPDSMFYSFVSMVGAGFFGYSLEKKTNQNN